jgi:hypothetical protein
MKSKARMEGLKCGILCLECSDLDNSQCNVCKTGIFQYNNSCYEKCPRGTYSDFDWQTCNECDSNCPVCWGPRSDQCGSTIGQATTVVLLENEIKNHFLTRNSLETDSENWLNNLDLVFKKIKSTGMTSLVTFGNYGPNQLENFEINIETLSPDDVYNTNKIEIDLPDGSFSRNNGVFIPIPSYLNKNMELVDSHWIFVKGMWDGHNWISSWFPKMPGYIKNHGQKNKIYIENRGYWIYEVNRGINNSNL